MEQQALVATQGLEHISPQAFLGTSRAFRLGKKLPALLEPQVQHVRLYDALRN
jgi:hypothetical protein